MTYIALIPAYKPAACLPELLKQLKDFGFEIFLIDDGSGAAYEHIFFECSRYAEVLHHIQNEGKGTALKTGLAEIALHYPKDAVVVTVDADGQHKPDDVLAVSKLAENNPGALVLGSRKMIGNVPLRSKLGNAVTRFVYRISTGLQVYDTQTGLRAFGTELIEKLLQIPGNRYEYEMNVLLYCAREHIAILEQPIETVYLEGNVSSHFNAAKDSARIYKEILKFSASSFIGFLADYTIYSILLLFGCRLTLSNIVARIISASVNFTLNRRLVFKSDGSLAKSIAKYALLAACILAGNTVVLNFLSGVCGIHRMIAKIITEAVFFILSWLAQKTVVFRRKGGSR